MDTCPTCHRPTDRYYLMIKTGPHQSWMHPSGWTAPTREAAIEMGRRADRLWMAVRVMDEATGKEVA